MADFRCIRAMMRAAGLACLALALLPRALHAGQDQQFARDDGPLVTVSDVEEVEPDSTQPPSVGQADLSIPGSTVVISDEAANQAHPYWARVARWTPQGMVPYVHRTPDSQKDRGIGQPLEGYGWRTNAFSISGFSGVTDGGPLVAGHVNQQCSYYGGINIAWDYDHYFGFEKRLGFGALNLTNGNHQPIPNTGVNVTGEYRLMYYPLGDSRWRPFLTAGIGWSDLYFNDDSGARHLDTVGTIPFGGGLKYLINPRIALRIDLIDELNFGTGSLSNFHYVALTAGLEFRYGHRLLNLPWHRKTSDGN